MKPWVVRASRRIAPRLPLVRFTSSTGAAAVKVVRPPSSGRSTLTASFFAGARLAVMTSGRRAMRTRQRGASITAAPPEWQLHCRQSFAQVASLQVRSGERSWWREYVELLEEGFVPCAGMRAERCDARSIGCSCGQEMSVRALLIGDEGELVARRTYAVGVMCGEWAEF